MYLGLLAVACVTFLCQFVAARTATSNDGVVGPPSKGYNRERKEIEYARMIALLLFLFFFLFSCLHTEYYLPFSNLYSVVLRRRMSGDFNCR